MSASMTSTKLMPPSGGLIFGWIRRTLSLKGFVEVELLGTELVPYGNGKFYGRCQLPATRKQMAHRSFWMSQADVVAAKANAE